MRQKIEARGTQLAFAHLSGEQKAQKFFSPYGLADLPRFSDPEGKLYQAFGLVQAHWRQYLNYESFLQLLIALLEGHWVGMPVGDVQRMPGVFLLVQGTIHKAYRHKLVSDRPDYLAMATVNSSSAQSRRAAALCGHRT